MGMTTFWYWMYVRRLIEGHVPPGLTKFRPHDEQMSSYIFRWKHDQVLASLGGKADFREPAQNTQAHVVLMAIAMT